VGWAASAAFATSCRRIGGNPARAAGPEPGAAGELASIVSALEAPARPKVEQFSERHGDWGETRRCGWAAGTDATGLGELGKLAGGMDYARRGPSDQPVVGRRLARETRLRRTMTQVRKGIVK